MSDCAHVWLLLGPKEVNMLRLRYPYAFSFVSFPASVVPLFHTGSLQQALSNQDVNPEALEQFKSPERRKATPYTPEPNTLHKKSLLS